MHGCNYGRGELRIASWDEESCHVQCMEECSTVTALECLLLLNGERKEEASHGRGFCRQPCKEILKLRRTPYQCGYTEGVAPTTHINQISLVVTRMVDDFLFVKEVALAITDEKMTRQQTPALTSRRCC